MALTPEQRAELIDGLISNCDCWADEDRELLNGFKDDKLQSFTENLSRTSTSKNESTSTETVELNELSTDDLKAEMKRRTDMEAAEKAPAENITSMTPEEYLKHAPEEIRNTFQQALQIENEQKDSLIAKMTAHITDNAEKLIQADRLRARTLSDLHSDLALLPPQETKEEEPTQNTTEESNLLSRVVNSLASSPTDEPLVAPTMTFGDEQYQDQSPLANVSETISVNDKDWLKSAPAGVRQLLSNALAVEKSQKDDIITRLVANIEDTNQRFRTRDRLESKSLEELKEMLSLVGNNAPSTKKATPNYAGANTPMTSNKLSDEEKHDILPLPVMSFDSKTG